MHTRIISYKIVITMCKKVKPPKIKLIYPANAYIMFINYHIYIISPISVISLAWILVYKISYNKIPDDVALHYLIHRRWRRRIIPVWTLQIKYARSMCLQYVSSSVIDTLTGSLVFLITFLVGCRKDLGLNAYRRTIKPMIKQVKRKSEGSRTFVCDPGTKKEYSFFFLFLITKIVI